MLFFNHAKTSSLATIKLSIKTQIKVFLFISILIFLLFFGHFLLFDQVLDLLPPAEAFRPEHERRVEGEEAAEAEQPPDRPVGVGSVRHVVLDALEVERAQLLVVHVGVRVVRSQLLYLLIFISGFSVFKKLLIQNC